MTSVWIGPPTARSGDHCRIGWFLRVHELNRSTQRHMRMKQRPTSPLTGLKFGFSGKRCVAGSATLASWIDETAVLVAVRRGKGDASPSGGNAVDETADIGTPKYHSGRLLRCKLLLLRCRTAAQDPENTVIAIAEHGYARGVWPASRLGKQGSAERRASSPGFRLQSLGTRSTANSSGQPRASPELVEGAAVPTQN